MYEINEPRCIEWNKDLGEVSEYAKKAILTILRDQKVSLTKTRTLFKSILDDIEYSDDEDSDELFMD